MKWYFLSVYFQNLYFTKPNIILGLLLNVRDVRCRWMYVPICVFSIIIFLTFCATWSIHWNFLHKLLQHSLQCHFVSLPVLLIQLHIPGTLITMPFEISSGVVLLHLMVARLVQLSWNVQVPLMFWNPWPQKNAIGEVGAGQQNSKNGNKFHRSNFECSQASKLVCVSSVNTQSTATWHNQ